MIRSQPLSLSGAAVLLAATLSACGGGDNANPSLDAPAASALSSAASDRLPGLPDAAEAVPATVEQLAAQAGAPTETAQGAVPGSTCGLAYFQAELMQRINAWRAKGASCGAYGSFAPTTALAWNDPLQSAAARHASDMKTNNFFSHTGSDGSNAGMRITQAGYAWGAWGENIAAGYPSAQAVVDGWMASPGHCANLMKPVFKHVGVACVKGGSANTYPTYWAMTLARPLQ